MGDMIRTGEIRVGEGRTAVVLRVEDLGRDLAATLTGGEAHVGAVAVAGAGVGTRGEDVDGMVVVPGHREDVLAREGARLLAARSGRCCVLTAGIHVDDASPDEIDIIVANAREAFRRSCAI